MQCFHKKRQLWSREEKSLALSIYYKSPATYRLLLNKLKFALPSISTIRLWLRVVHLSTGINQSIISRLREKVKCMSSAEKQAVLLFDEISIKKHLQYSSPHDFIEGFEDLGVLGRTSRIGTQVMVFMVRGLILKWKLPVAYYVSAGSMKSSSLKILLIDVVKSLLEIGLQIHSVICDQGSNNRAVFRELGVTTEFPFFYVNDKKIYALFDTPHLIKSVRNTLLKGNIHINNKEVSFDDIRKFYDLDKTNKIRANVKLTDSHINPNAFEKMKVKLATQIFSHKLATGLETVVQTGEIKSKTMENTAQFLKKMNTLFDILNSRLLKDENPYRRPLSVRNPKVENVLRESLQWVSEWKVLNPKTKKERKNIYCISGLQHTIRGVLEIWSDLREEGYSFLLTSRLQQDLLEKLFSAVRSKGGFNFNPSCASVRASLQFNIFMGLQQPPETKNCETGDDISLDLGDPNQTKPLLLREHELQQALETEDLASSSSNTDEEYVPPTLEFSESLETCSIYYVAGYLLYKIINKFKCKICENILSDDSEIPLGDKKELLIVFRDYGRESSEKVQHLKRPSEYLARVVKLTVEVFYYIINKYKHCCNIMTILKNRVETEIKRQWGEWFRNDQCLEHRKFATKFLLGILLLKVVKWYRAELKGAAKRTGGEILSKSSGHHIKKVRNY
ncbi:hypothetical protein ILUMI_00604 [Ignelater luminosus]|uniref:Transposase n=1 Tax=Ignelater luminosus TaxID=2038154 RepID=A0A8K0DJW2_IGNLU|nr:hypothetical protein ILUMI_00604 [Ignelater luminosus]